MTLYTKFWVWLQPIQNNKNFFLTLFLTYLLLFFKKYFISILCLDYLLFCSKKMFYPYYCYCYYMLLLLRMINWTYFLKSTVSSKQCIFDCMHLCTNKDFYLYAVLSSFCMIVDKYVFFPWNPSLYSINKSYPTFGVNLFTSLTIITVYCRK